MITAAGPPGIRPVLEALRRGPVAVLIAGGAGTGKSTALASVRRRLSDDGRTVLARAPRGGDDPDAAVVVDDAHLLAGPELQRLTRIAEDPTRSLVVAAELRVHDRDLRALIEALERSHPPIALQSMGGPDVRAALSGGGPLPEPEILDAAMAATAGLPFLVFAVAAARPTTPADVERVAFHALVDRVRRLDGRTLEALLIATLNYDLGAADIGAALELPNDDASALIDDIRGTGLAGHTLPESFRGAVHQAVARSIGVSRHREVESALLQTQLELSTLSGELALRLAEHGLRDQRLVEPLSAGAAAEHDASWRTRYLRAAVECGATDRRAELADALALSGDCSGATALADDLLAATAPAARAAGVRVAAAVAAHDGNSRQAAELFGWLGPYPDAAVGTAAVIVHIGIGDAAAAAAALAAGHTGPPTAAARAARSLAEGLMATVTRHYPVAAATLGQAAAEAAIPLAMPDTAPALATLAALHNGDAPRARSLIARAVAAELPAHRHRLLRGWLRMQEGRLAGATADAAAATAAQPTLHRRDALWAAALCTAIARRSGDTGALQQHWAAAMDTLAECAVDLYSLLPLGELWIAAARLRQVDRLGPALDQAREVLAALGEPTAWTPALHWAGMHAGMLANDPAAVAPHGQALAAAAAQSPFAAALAGAGRTWLRVLAGQVEPDDVVVAARAVARFGLTSDATRLAGQAALYTADPKASAVLLQVARDLKMAADGDDGPHAPPDAGPPVRPRAPSAALSDREREVAELLLLGMPYRDIGAQLFISAKTVEHHVARIRRRLGAGSRSEVLSMLRSILNTGAAPEQG